MPPNDQEPRYQLVDSNGNIVGSLFGDGSGNVVIADETDTQTTFDANGITTPALEADDSVSKVRNDEVVYSGHPDFSSPQDADTFAVNNGYHVVEVPQGNYGQLKPSENIKIVGLPSEIAAPSAEQAKFASSGASAIAIEGNRRVVESVAVVGGTSSNGSPHHGFNIGAHAFVRISNCLINGADGDGINCDGNRVRILGCHFRTSNIDRDEVLLSSNSARCVIDGCSSQGGVTVTNNGTDNVVGDNA